MKNKNVYTFKEGGNNMGKKVVSLVLALSMIFSLSVPAFANADDELLDSSVLTENVETFMDKKNEEEVVFDVSETLSEKELNENFDKDKIENVVTDSLSDKNFTYDVNPDAEIKVSDTISFDTNTIENNIMIMNLAAQVNEEPVYALDYRNNGKVTVVIQRGATRHSDDEKYGRYVQNLGVVSMNGYTTQQLRGQNKSVSSAPWGRLDNFIEKIEIIDEIYPISTAYWFCNLQSIKEINGLQNINASNLTDTTCMFYFISGVKKLDVSDWDTTNLKSTDSMFYNCFQLESLDLSNWDVSNLQSTNNMFYNCYALTSIGNVSNWDTKNFTSTACMFCNCYKLENLDVSRWNTSKITKAAIMFKGCKSLTELDVSNWNTYKFNSIWDLFNGCENLEVIDVSNFRFSVKDMLRIFQDCKSVKKLDFSKTYILSNATFNNVFTGCNKLEEVKIPFGAYKLTAALPIPSSEFIANADGNWYNEKGEVMDRSKTWPAGTYYAYPKKYTVTFNFSSLPEISNETQKVLCNSLISKPELISKPGYTLDSWLKTDGTAWNFDKDIVTSDITLTAKWTPGIAQYKVKHYLQSLDDEYILWQTDTKESVTESKVHADPKNYGNFHYSEGNIFNVQDGTVVGDGSLVLSIYYDRDIYTVEFEADSVEAEVIDDQLVMYEDTAEDPGDPLHFGYTMMGWKVTKMEYIAPGEPDESSPNIRMRKTKVAMLRTPSNEDLYDFSTPVVGNMELTAVWVANGDTKYKVEHWIWDKDSNQYILKETENLMALTDAEVYAQPKVYEGMHEVYDAEGRINHGTVIGNGSLVLRLYYDFNEYGVTINPNNGDDATEISAIYGEKLEEPSVPYREGFVFNGWYISNDNTKPYDFSIPVTHDFTLVASWVIPDTETPVVEIKNPEDKPASYAKVSIKQGNTIYKEGITDGEGKFSLKDIPDGYYNLVIEHENIVKTPIIEVSKDTENIEVHLRAETINSLLNVNEGTKDVVVGGLTTIYSNENLYTEEDKQLVSEGNIVAYSMNVKTATQEEIEERSPDLILAANTDNKEISGYLKMDLTKYRATSDGEILSTEILPDLYGHLLEIHVPLREDQQGKEGYIVYRMHDGIVSEITETPNENGAYMTLIDGNNNGKIDELVVYASKFSDYCLAYDKPKYIVTINYDNGLESSVYSVIEDTKIVKPENPIKDGYTFSKWVIKDTEIEFDFETVITEDIEIVAIYTKNTVIDLQPTYNDDDGPYRPFTDVKHKDLFYKEVYEAYDKKLVEGESHNKFNPNGNMDRASTAHIFYQLNKVKNFKYKDVFKDVKENTKYAKDIIWANENNVMIGYGNPWFGNFGPKDSLTREQFALVLYRVYHKNSDKYDWEESMLEEAEKVSEWAREAMCWCVGKGMIKGNENGDLMPQKAVSRAEACAIVIRFVKENNKK